jgi:hypothetical protein
MGLGVGVGNCLKSCWALSLFPKWNIGKINNFAGRKIELLRRILRISNENVNLFEGCEKTE